MTDMPPKEKPPAAEVNGQLITALAIVAAMVIIALALIFAGVYFKEPTIITGGVFTIIGAMATALNAPTGISAALRASKAPDNQ